MKRIAWLLVLCMPLWVAAQGVRHFSYAHVEGDLPDTWRPLPFDGADQGKLVYAQVMETQMDNSDQGVTLSLDFIADPDNTLQQLVANIKAGETHKVVKDGYTKLLGEEAYYKIVDLGECGLMVETMVCLHGGNRYTLMYMTSKQKFEQHTAELDTIVKSLKVK